jgi:hypothetical protein
MRASPAFQVSLQRFGVWRAAVWLLTALALGTIVTWLASRPPPLGAGTLALAAAGTAALTWLAVSMATQRPIDLIWDGRNWSLGAPNREPVAGDLSVALDLGGWMLLRFKPLSSSAFIWVTAQRWGLEAAWHGLRCAVHAARPAGPDDDALGGER